MAIIGTLPVILQNGTTADATQVMSDFNFIVNQVNANALSTSFVAPGTLLSVQVFSAIGTSTYTPNANASKAWVRGVGAGGAGGGALATSAGTVSAGLGGTAGCYGEIFIASGLSSQTVTVAAGGVGASGGTGNTSGNCSFGSLLVLGSAVGGIVVGPAATFVLSSTQPVSVVSGTGTIIVSGKGPTAKTPTIALAASANQVCSGAGADSIWGAGGVAVNGQANGQNAQGFGGGGGGAMSTNGGGAQAGGSGGQGVFVVFEYA